MCGRFVRNSDILTITTEFNIEQTSFDLEPSYNVAPTQNIIIIINDGKKQLIECEWGFIPSWAKEPSVGNKMINARSETVADKPTFKSAFKNRRCLVVADGFYEWRKEGGVKIPIYIHLKSGKPFGFAGLYNPWISPEGDQICTCTIVTTEANELLKPIHNRMPVIIPEDQQDLWLDPAVQEKEPLLSLLNAFDSKEMDFYDVSPMVNSPKNNSPDIIKPISIS